MEFCHSFRSKRRSESNRLVLEILFGVERNSGAARAVESFVDGLDAHVFSDCLLKWFLDATVETEIREKIEVGKGLRVFHVFLNRCHSQSWREVGPCDGAPRRRR